MNHYARPDEFPSDTPYAPHAVCDENGRIVAFCRDLDDAQIIANALSHKPCPEGIDNCLRDIAEVAALNPNLFKPQQHADIRRYLKEVSE